MIPNEKFRFELKPEGNGTRIIMKGSIDEDTSFEPLKRATGALIINFRGVTAINSCGIRTWVNFVKELSKTGMIYEECPPLIVRQMNMVPSFLGHAKVASVYVPYVCDSCDHEKMNLIQASMFSGNIPELIKCDSCGKEEMELDGNPKQYFAFAK